MAGPVTHRYRTLRLLLIGVVAVRIVRAVAVVLVHELVQQLVEGGHVLVDDAVAVLGLRGGADHLLVGVEVVTRRAGAEQDVVRAVRAKDHLQKLGEVLLVGHILGVVEDVEQVVLLKTVAQLLDLLTDDDVGLEVEQVVDLALDGGLGKDARRTDERRGGQPGVDRGRDLERTQDRGLGATRSTSSANS